jgi:hypothetical protein
MRIQRYTINDHALGWKWRVLLSDGERDRVEVELPRQSDMAYLPA